jgi:hypothetical protein
MFSYLVHISFIRNRNPRLKSRERINCFIVQGQTFKQAYTRGSDNIQFSCICHPAFLGSVFMPPYGFIPSSIQSLHYSIGTNT